MSTRLRNSLMIAAVLIISVVGWGAASAQSATSTAEPSSMTAEATTEAATPAPAVQAHGFLGVALQDSANGVTVSQVLPGTAAAMAGIQVGDVITAINGTTINTAADASSVVSGLASGAQVTIALTRAGSSMTVTATLGTPPKPVTNSQGQPMNPPQGQQNPPPGQVNPGGPNIPAGRGFGFTYNQADQSRTITNLSTNSPLYTDGLRQGDVVTTVDGKMYNPMTLLQYLRTVAQGTKVTLSVTRSGQTMNVQVSPSDLTSLFGRFGGGFGGGSFGGGANGGGGFGGGAASGLAQMAPLFRMMATTGHLGIAYQTINAQVAQANNLTVTDGALVTQVESGSAADKAGIKANDVITAVDGTKIDAKHPLVYLLLPYQSGDMVTLSVLSGGQSQDIQVTLTQSTNTMGGGMIPFMMPFLNGNGGFGGFGGFGGGGFGGRGNGNNAPGQNQPQATPSPNA